MVTKKIIPRSNTSIPTVPSGLVGYDSEVDPLSKVHSLSAVGLIKELMTTQGLRDPP